MDLKSGSTHIPSPTSVSSVIQAELVNSSQSNEILMSSCVSYVFKRLVLGQVVSLEIAKRNNACKDE